MDILEKLFNSRYRAKLLRLFVFNPEDYFKKLEICKRSKIPVSNLRKELNTLLAVKLIKEKNVIVKSAAGRKRVKAWQLDPMFPLTANIRALLNADFLRQRADMAKRFKNCGKVKLLVVSGVFISDEDRRLDLLLVGDKLKKNNIDNIIKTIEADVGREITYAILDSDEFLYRNGTSDKFIRDIFDYPHERIIDKLIF
ncbi:MAG: hypothetical protein QG609_451 [Patescibacteria group bacterium]|nr:hypothetical protein [Patescibacteria group bacterium]